MRKEIAGPALIVSGGVLALVTMIFGWTTVTLSWRGQMLAKITSHGSPMSLFGACLLILVGFVLVWHVRARRTRFAVLAILAAALLLIAVVVAFSRSFGVDNLTSAAAQSSDEVRHQIQEWMAQGASVDGSRSIGLFLALAGGLLGLTGGVFAIRNRNSHSESLPPAPPLPAGDRRTG
jgi:purine-cytosine permease-like protein